MTNPTPPDHLDGDVTIPRRTLAGIAAALLGLAALVAALAGVDLDDLTPGGGPGPTSTTSTSTSTSSTSTSSTSTPPGPAGPWLVNYAEIDGLADGDADLAAAAVAARGMTDPAWTRSVAAEGIPPTNGPSADGQFRLNCHVHHLSKDDPVVWPDQPGRAHWHQFFGNTEADAFSTAASLLASGDSSCQGGPNNRSAYWTPAMLDAAGNFVAPEIILLYYKSKRPADVIEFPAGLQLVAGLLPDGVSRETIEPGAGIVWGCYANGATIRQTAQIPGTPGTAPCPDNQSIALDIQFPECLARDPNGPGPRTTSADLLSHAYYPNAGVGQMSGPCPAAYPFRIPQITYKLRWANPPGAAEADWRLSCDHGTQPAHPGGCAHADWLGAWSPPANQAWLVGCFATPSNCSQGQTGGPRRFAPFTGGHIGTGGANQLYTGPQRIPIRNE